MKSLIYMPDLILTKTYKALPEKILGGANDSPALLLWLACSGMALPLVMLIIAAVQGRLGINPLDVLTRKPGYWSLVFLTLALCVAPIRHACVFTAKSLHWQYGKRLSDWNFLIRLRRPIGLASFFMRSFIAVFMWP
jgi:DMSO/TMAO reductase YedYZ heme-binding membrane subunit